MADYIDDYEPFTAALQLRVSATDDGRGLFATEALDREAELLDEVPLVAWPIDPRSAASCDATFCEACMCVFARSSRTSVKCSDAGCGALFCSEVCATGGVYRSGLRGGALPALRAGANAVSAESVARCNARIVQNVGAFAAGYGLPAPVALANALRPYERLCASPAESELDLPAEAVADALRTHTLSGLESALKEHLAEDEAHAMALELTSVPHVDGLLQRLHANTIGWEHPRHRALRFGGVFVLASLANHDCAPNVELAPSWTRSGSSSAADGDGDDAAAAKDGDGDGDGDGACETFSLILRTTAGVACGDELRRSYVGVGLPRQERRALLSSGWGFACECERCRVDAETPPSKKRRGGAVVPPTPPLPTPPQPPVLVTRERPEEAADDDDGQIERRVAASAARGRREGDWRYSVLPAVVPAETVLRLSRAFFEKTELLRKDGNTFGPEFEQYYAGHKNYFYYINRNKLVAGADVAAAIFEELDAYTRRVVELHHPGKAVRLDRAFGAYYEGRRDGFHLGVSEHCDGGANLVSTVVHATLPDGDCGFREGGALTVSAVDGLPEAPIAHSNDTVGSVVYLGPSVYHHASPIQEGGKRLVFCMFYACETDLERHALA